MVNWPEVLPLLRSQGLGCVADEIEKMRTLLDQGAMTISDLKQLIAVESCEGELKDAVIEAAKQFRRVVPQYPDDWNKEHRALGTALSALVSEGLAPE